MRSFLAPARIEGTKPTAKRLLNLYLSRYEQWRGHTRLRAYPIKLVVEPTNACNLRCPACFTGREQVGRTRSPIPFDLYRRILDEVGDYLLVVDFGNWGEPLLCKHLPAMIAEAKARGIATALSTNLSFPFSPEQAAEIVSSGLTVFGVSIDGATQDTYEQYRVRGRLDTVLANCRTIAETRRRLGSTSPKLIWEFHVFPHNAGDIPLATSLAEELGMSITVSRGWVLGRDGDSAAGVPDYHEPKPARCWYLWNAIIVNNDGGVPPCCGTFYREDDFATVASNGAGPTDSSIMAAWNNDRFRRARSLFKVRDGSSEVKALVCYDCPQTLTWHQWSDHLANGGTLEAFRPVFTGNDWFNYFAARQPSLATKRLF